MILSVLDGDVDSGGVTKEVVHITQYLLIGPHEEDTQVILIVLPKRVDGKGMRVGAVGDKLGYLPIRVTSDILKGSIARGPFIQPLNGHDGEQLVDGPGVGQRLEQGEVAEVLVSQQLVDIHQLLRDMLEVLGQRMDFVAHAPVHRLHFGTRLEVDNAMSEEVEHLLADLFCIVPVFEHITR